MSSGTKKFQFLLLDASPIIKLFGLGIWDTFIQRCDVSIARVVAGEAKYASREFEDIFIDLSPYEDNKLITIVDVELSAVKMLYNGIPPSYKIDPGEEEMLAFLIRSSGDWKVCAADAAVFSTLGFLGKSEQGISLEELLSKVGLARALEWQFSKRFRERYTKLGQIDAVQR